MITALADVAAVLPVQVYAVVMVACLSGAVAIVARLAHRQRLAARARYREALAARRRERAARFAPGSWPAYWPPAEDPWPTAAT